MAHLDLKDLLLVLYRLKADLHDEANASAVEKLDELIELVESQLDDDVTKVDRTQVLRMLGQFLERLPTVAALIKLFHD